MACAALATLTLTGLCLLLSMFVTVYGLLVYVCYCPQLNVADRIRIYGLFT